jgi:hypothetical protein
MKANDIFQKTMSGLSEIGNRSDALTVKQRRVLILVNGENNTATLKQLSLCENIVEILEILLRRGFIDHDGSGTAYDHAPDTTSPVVVETGAREFMCNTLLTFANRIRVSPLIDQIKAVEDVDSLKNLVTPWYQAISETPGGMYQADDLKQEVMRMLDAEGIAGIR